MPTNARARRKGRRVVGGLEAGEKDRDDATRATIRTRMREKVGGRGGEGEIVSSCE